MEEARGTGRGRGGEGEGWMRRGGGVEGARGCATSLISYRKLNHLMQQCTYL